MKDSIYLLVFGDNKFGLYEVYEGFCFRSYGEAATYLNEVEGMFVKTFLLEDEKNTFYKPEDDNIWAIILKVPITKNKLERKGWL